ncbi:MAG: ATP-binding protein [Aquisalinus sp.]|nr:ATP-binding protein [Aquisalinus sp.]
MPLLEIIWPTKVDGDILDLARRRLLVVLSFVIGVFGAVSGTTVGLSTFEQAPVMSVAGAVLPLFMLAIPFFAYFTRRFRVSSIILLLSLYGVILIVATSDRGVLSPALYYFPTLPVVTGLLLGHRPAVFAAVFVVLNYLWLTPHYLTNWEGFALSILASGLTLVICIFQREMEKVTQALQIARSEAEAGNAAKTEFLANMSHELRTPLNGVLGMAQLLDETRLDQKQKQYTETILKSGRSLLAIIQNVLDFSKIEANELLLEEEGFDLAELLDEVSSTISGIALQKGLDLQVRVDPAIAGQYRGDVKKLRQILINFAGNAVKFTESGKVVISATREGEEIRLAVSDTGPGIPEDQQARVFERFRQVDGSVTRRHGGAGLGLAISQQFADLMGGRIGVKSLPGEGSTFFICLTMKKTGRALSLIPVSAEPAPDLAPPMEEEAEMRVLLVEDNAVNREVIKAALRKHRVVIHEVENGADALEQLEAGEVYDVVLMDVQMPVMSGEEALHRIRSAEAPYQRVPVVMITANAERLSLNRYLSMGANGNITKPFNITTLYDTISGYCRRPMHSDTSSMPGREAASQ